MAKTTLTKLAFRLHGWLGLTAGIFFLLFGLTGSLLIFRADLDRFFNKELHQLRPTGNRISVDSMYRMIAATHPNLKKIVLHDFPADRFDSYEFMVYQNQQKMTDNYLYFIFVNPYDGRILKEGSYGDLGPSFFRWLYAFHYSLQLGMPGKLFAAIVGLVMLLSLLTGAVIYRKHFWDVLRFKAGWNMKNRRVAISSLHRLIGVWATLFTALLFFTGFWMSKEHVTPAKWQLMPLHVNYIVKADIDQMITQCEEIVPGFLPIAVNIPAFAGEDVVVRGRMPGANCFLFNGKASGLSFDPLTGRFKKLSNINKADVDKRFDAAVYSLHVGNYGGNWIRSLYVILGMMPGMLSITGGLLWFNRKKGLNKKPGKNRAV